MPENILSGKIVITAPGVQKVFNDLNQSTTSLIRSLKNDLDPAISKAFKSGVISVGNMRGALDTLKENMRITTNPAQIIRYNAAIKDLEVNIKKVSAAGLASGNALSAGFTKGFSALRTLANIIPGIGIGGLVSLAIQPLTAAFGGMSKAAEETAKKLKELIKPIKDIRETATAGTAEELSKVNALVKAVLDQTKSYGERNNALNQLKGINKNYFGDLTLEADKLATLKGRVEEYTKAIIAASVVKAFGDEIGKIAVEINEQERAYVKLGKAVFGANEVLKKSLEVGKQVRTIQTAGGEVVSQVALNKTVRALDKQGEVVSKLKNQYKDLSTAIDVAVENTLKFKPLETDVAIKLAPKFEFIPLKTIENINKAIGALALNRGAAFVIPISADLAPTLNVGAIQKNLQAALSFFALKTSTLTIPIEVPKVPLGILKEMKESAENTARAVSDVLAPAFADLFTAIIDGESPIKAFFNSIIQSINQVIQRLIAAAIQAAIFSIISGGGTSFGKAFSNILGGLGAGGQRTPGGIGFSNQAIRINLSGGFQVRGNDLVIAYNRTISSQGRTG